MNTFGLPRQVAAVLDDRSQFRCTVPGDPHGAAQARTCFADWLQRHFQLREQQLSDLTLAVNEALADAAEHSRVREEPSRGSRVEIVATYDQEADVLTVQVVSDERKHAPADPTPATTHPDGSTRRGLGTDLMRLLADQTQIHTTPGQRTQVLLTWTALQRSPKSLTVLTTYDHCGDSFDRSGSRQQRTDCRKAPDRPTTNVHSVV